jgi:hypothetical protein
VRHKRVNKAELLVLIDYIYSARTSKSKAVRDCVCCAYLFADLYILIIRKIVLISDLKILSYRLDYNNLTQHIARILEEFILNIHPTQINYYNL